MSALTDGNGSLWDNAGQFDDVYAKATCKDRGVLEYFEVGVDAKCGPVMSGQSYEVEADCPDISSLCPVTGEPWFGKIRISYRPRERCVETKSLRLYLNGFRNAGWFHEELCKAVCADLAILLLPARLAVEGEFPSRGDIAVRPRVVYCDAEGDGYE